MTIIYRIYLTYLLNKRNVKYQTTTNKYYRAEHYKSTRSNITYNVKEYLKNNINDLRQTKWLSGLIQTLIIGLTTSLVLYIIRSNSKGALSGEELKEYLTSITCDALNIQYDLENDNIQFDISFTGDSDTISSTGKVLVSVGKYRTSDCALNDLYNGRFIVLFEKENNNFFYDFIGLEPKFKIAFLKFIELDSDFASSLQYIYDGNYIIDDFDKNGTLDLIISFYNIFADIITETYIILTKINNKWEIINLPFEEVFKKDEYNSFYYSDYCLFIESAIAMDNPHSNFNDNGNKIYSFVGGGNIEIIENPQNNKKCFLLRVVALGYKESLLSACQQIYVCFDYNKGKFEVNKRWNGGEPLIVRFEELENSGDFNPNKYWYIN